VASIVVVCTGNVCRSPIAEGTLRAALWERLSGDAPSVSSAGTSGWDGSSAMPESVAAAAERGVDITSHVARRLTASILAEADLVVCMAAEHRREAARLLPEAAARTFTLKELVRLLEALPNATEARPVPLVARVAGADDLRRKGFEGNPDDEDVVDPLGLGLETYRSIAWELEAWTARLADALVERAPARSGAGNPGA
jgi:protein-tyrosine phosphatase